VLGIIFGLIMASLFSRALRVVKTNEFVAATLLLISAHLVFITSELINESGFFGLDIHISSIIATTIAALFLGNYSRHILSPSADSYLQKVTEHFAFMANSLVFLLAGLLFASSGIDFRNLILPILLTVLVVATVRVIAVYMITVPLNMLRLEQRIPSSWQLLLSWGSLRGALAIIIVLLIPESLTVDGWSQSYSVRDFTLALTIGCILATLFIKAPLIGTIIRKLKIDEPEPLQVAYEADMGIYYLYSAQSRFATQKTRGFVRDNEYAQLKNEMLSKINSALAHRAKIRQIHGEKVFVQSLHYTAMRIEDYTLKQLYANKEISEQVYRRIRGKLNLQKEKIQYAQHDTIDPSKYIDRKDIFDRMVRAMQTPIFTKESAEEKIEEKLQYYRAQMIIARKVTKILGDMQVEHESPTFFTEVYDKVVNRYATYRRQCSERVDGLLEKHPQDVSVYMARLAERSLNASGARALGRLHHQGVIDEDTELVIEHKFGL